MIKNCQKNTMRYGIRLKVYLIAILLKKNLIVNQCILINILILK